MPRAARPSNALRAAAVWLAVHPVLKLLERQHDDAAGVLKEHFRTTGQTTFAGIRYARSVVRRLDLAAARQALGPETVARLTVDGSRETLSPVEDLPAAS